MSRQLVCVAALQGFVLAAAAFGQASKFEPRATIPVITSVVNSASGQPGIVSGSWATIYGTGLSNTTRVWNSADFIDGNLPPQMDFISVTVNAQHAFVEYVSPTQLNILVPDDPTLGPVAIQAYGQLLQSNFFYANKVAAQPALFTFSAKYPAAAHLDGSFAGPAGLIPGVVTTPVRPNETVVLFGTGFGASSPLIPTGMLFSTAAPIAQNVTATVGGVSAPVKGYLISPGLYQFNLTVPNLGDGDAAVVVTLAGTSTQAGLSLAIAK